MFIIYMVQFDREVDRLVTLITVAFVSCPMTVLCHDLTDHPTHTLADYSWYGPQYFIIILLFVMYVIIVGKLKTKVSRAYSV